MAVIIGLLLQFSLQAAEAPPATIHVETAGTLSSLIASNKKYEITNLKLTGNLNGTDIRYIREMAGRDVRGAQTEGKLSILDMLEVKIVEGGNYYYKDNSYHKYEYYTANVSTGIFSYNPYYPSGGTPQLAFKYAGIADYMFLNCKLTSIALPNNESHIDDNAFDGCTGLTSVTFGTENNASSILNNLPKCPNLKEYIVVPDNKNYSSLDGVLFNKDKTHLVRYPIAKEGTSYTIPNSVTSIGSFSGCTGLTSVIIPNSVISIGDFSGCTGLTSITIPNSVTSIGERSFSDCTGLTSVIIPNGVTSLSGFSGCTGLTSITIPNSVTSIGHEAFRGCIGLTSITIPNSVTSIGHYAFSGCTGLTSIPNSVTEIGYGAFSGCTGLTSVAISNSIVFLRYIYYSANRAFQNCTGLKKIYMACPVPPDFYFTGVSTTDCILYVPIGSYSSYWAATGWGDFENIVEMDMTNISVDNITDNNFNTYMHGNTLIIEGTEQNMNITVYTISGQIIYQTIANGKTDIPLNKGIYIVRVNNENQKVIVK